MASRPEENGGAAGPVLFAGPGQALRFVPRNLGFIRRTRLVNALLSGWPVVVGTGSWVEAHLVARLGMANRVPNLRGCGINANEVWDLVQEVLREEVAPPLVVLMDSLEDDQARGGLIRNLRELAPGLQILLLVQQDQWLSEEALQNCQAQAIVHVHNFGSGVIVQALQALRHGKTFRDPLLKERLLRAETFGLSPRERQVLQGLARGLTNKQIAQEQEIAATTVRDYVSSLCRRLGAGNRTLLVSRAISLGLVRSQASAAMQNWVSQAQGAAEAETSAPAGSNGKEGAPLQEREETIIMPRSSEPI